MTGPLARPPTTPLTRDQQQALSGARRRDWLLVAVCHVVALGLTALVIVGLCATHATDQVYVFVPHYFYWTVALVFASSPTLAWLCLLAAAFVPIGLYRSLAYVRHGGTRALFEAGLQGTWTSEPGRRRRRAALRAAFLPTWFLLREGAGIPPFEQRAPTGARPPRLFHASLVALSISFHHLPMNAALETAWGIAVPWRVLPLPTWRGPCQFELTATQPDAGG